MTKDKDRRRLQDHRKFLRRSRAWTWILIYRPDIADKIEKEVNRLAPLTYPNRNKMKSVRARQLN